MHRLVRGALRRLAASPLRLVDAQTRAEAIEQLTTESVAAVAVPGGTLRFHAPTALLRSRAATLLTKEPDTIAWLETLGPDAVLWDLGANVGAFTLYAAMARRCLVLAFEPSAPNFFVLSRNIQLNALSDRVTAYCLAIAGATGLGVLNLDSADLGSAMSQFGRPGESSRYSQAVQPIVHGMIGMTLDDFVARFAPPFPTHFKIDVDGLEWPILQGGAATLRDQRVRAVLVELSLTQIDEQRRAAAFLETCGFSLVSRGAPQGAAREQAANHLFERR
jgi:FkbM family methyltransferase